MTQPAETAPAIELTPPDIEPYRAGNTGEWVAATSPTRKESYFGDWNFEAGQFENLELDFSPANSSVDPDFSPARTDQFVISFEHAIYEEISIAATFIAKRGRKLSNWTDAGGIYAPIPYEEPAGIVSR